MANCKGLAVITVLKAGFLGSARFGSGIIVARLSDGSWSAPSAIGTAGGGFGGQIGFELTDFVFVLNDYAAVRTFSQQASITLGGNVSIAAGPVGRNAEAAGAASLKGVSGVFSYSKTKGLFAGVSLEGSVLIERRDANEKLYNGKITARELLSGSIPPPAQAEPLMRILNSRIFSGAAPGGGAGEEMYNDIPIYDDRHDDVVWEGRTGQAYGAGVRRDRTGSVTSPGGPNRGGDEYEYRDNPRPNRSSTWSDDVYDRAPASPINRDSRSNTFGSQPPGRPTGTKPVFNKPQRTGSLAKNEAIAKFTFDADQKGDLSFKKGDVITIIKRTENETDWWTGRIGDREGIFPRQVSFSSSIPCSNIDYSNYVEMM